MSPSVESWLHNLGLSLGLWGVQTTLLSDDSLSPAKFINRMVVMIMTVTIWRRHIVIWTSTLQANTTKRNVAQRRQDRFWQPAKVILYDAPLKHVARQPCSWQRPGCLYSWPHTLLNCVSYCLDTPLPSENNNFAHFNTPVHRSQTCHGGKVAEITLICC